MYIVPQLEKLFYN